MWREDVRTDACTLLYIDPDAGTRLLVRKVLEPEGVVVVEAGSATEAQASADRLRPDIVLVDVDRVGPAELIPALRVTAGLDRIVLLASTAHTWPEHVEKILGWGFERVLLKPLDIDALAAELGCPARSRDPAGPSIERLGGVDHVTNGAVAAPPSLTTEESDAAPITTGELHLVKGAEEAETDTPPAGGLALEDDTKAEPPSAGAPVEADTPTLREVPQLWRLTLSPVTTSFVQSIPATHGLLALLEEGDDALVVVASTSLRPGDRTPTVGACVSRRSVPWLEPALRDRQTPVIATEAIAESPLVPPDSATILTVPVATADRVLGVVVVGEQRRASVAPFATATIGLSAAEARQMATVVEALRQLDRVMRDKRHDAAHVRLTMLHAVIADAGTRSRRPRKHESGRDRGRRRQIPVDTAREALARLAMELAERAEVSPREREVLRQALEVEDIGRTWLEQVLFPRTTLSDSARTALLESYPDQSAEILTELEWPPAVVQLVRTQRGRWDELGFAIPLAGRVLAVVNAYAELAAHADAARVPGGLDELAGTRLDPALVTMFLEMLASRDDAEPQGDPEWSDI